jgi:hypothetical protein
LPLLRRRGRDQALTGFGDFANRSTEHQAGRAVPLTFVKKDGPRWLLVSAPGQSYWRLVGQSRMTGSDYRSDSTSATRLGWKNEMRQIHKEYGNAFVLEPTKLTRLAKTPQDVSDLSEKWKAEAFAKGWSDT